MKPEISIIVPVYNTVMFFEECVESILSQTFTTFELILIDDGSTDGSGELCDMFVEKDSRVQVTHVENGGVTAARKIGLSKSRADWISFVDSDDTIPVDALSTLWEGHLAYDTDFVVGFMDDTQYFPPSVMPLGKWREICVRGDGFLPGPVARLINRSLFDDGVFAVPRSVVKGEDMLMNIRLSFKMTKDPVIVHKKVYDYRKNPDSCVHTFLTNDSYEENFHLLCLESIPFDDRDGLMKATIHHRLLKLNELYDVAPFDNKWRFSPFISCLLDDIKKTSYPVSIIARMKMMPFGKVGQKVFRTFLKLDSWQYRIRCTAKVAVKRLISKIR